MQGAYSLVVLTRDAVLALRDPHGFRPLCIGRLGDGYVVASETCALDLVARRVRARGGAGRAGAHRPAGHARAPRAAGRRAAAATASSSTSTSRGPTAVVFGETVDRVRRRIGHRLAEEHPADADVVIAVPDSSNSIALGYSEQSGHPLRAGPDPQPLRRPHVHPAAPGRARLERAGQVQPGARGARRASASCWWTTRSCAAPPAASWCACCARAGAREVHFRVGSPPVTHPVLLRHRHAEPPRADRRAQDGRRDPRLPRRRTRSATSRSRACWPASGSRRSFCRACFTGDYPVPVDPERRASSRSRSCTGA